jgi:hypothetical protein
VAVLAGCWRSAAPPKPEEPSGFEIVMERTECLGTCPAYIVKLDGEGRVRWRGTKHVNALGDRKATVPPKRIKEIERKLVEVRFFERDENGELPDPGPICVREGNTGSCSWSRDITICSDTSIARISVRRGTQKHVVQNAHCTESPLDDLEALIDDIARTTAWIGERITPALDAGPVQR